MYYFITINFSRIIKLINLLIIIQKCDFTIDVRIKEKEDQLYSFLGIFQNLEFLFNRLERISEIINF